MIKFTDIINESNKQEYNGSVTLKELEEFINKTSKILPNIVRDALYLVKKYEILEADDINTILNTNKSSINSLAKKFDMDADSMEELWNLLKDLKSNIKLFPHFLTPFEQKSLIKGTARIEDLTIDLETAQGQNEAIKQYMPVVNKVVNQYVGKSKLNRSDLMSAAHIAIANAIKDWDRSKGQLFKTYLSYRVQQQILLDIEEGIGRSLSGANAYNREKYGVEMLNAVSIDGMPRDEEGEFRQDRLAALGYVDGRDEEAEVKQWKKVFEILEKKFKQRDLDIFYSYFGLNGYKKDKSKDIAKRYGMSEGNIRNSIINKILAFLKKDKESLELLVSLMDSYNESLMIELLGCDKDAILERLSNDDIYILLEEITKWNNKDVFKRALAGALDGNSNIILNILKGGFEDVDNNIKKYKKDIIKFLSNMYPTENMTRKTDVDLIEYMLELQEIYKKHNK
jgi:RNA polymerase sigma factor (sigma-70 family)